MTTDKLSVIEKEISKICDWLKEQPEYLSYPITHEVSIFYHTAPAIFAKLIQRYVAAIQPKQEANGWISVEDRLPENSEPVLVATNEGGTIFYHVAEIWGQTEWSTVSEILHFVTHWKHITPLP